jgi:ISXO2-like transposase domain/Transposase zinc-ribbon domain
MAKGLLGVQVVNILVEPHFHCEEAACEQLEAIVWPNGPVCPHCGEVDRITVVGRKTARSGLKRCLQCKLQFRATVGTFFESSHIKLHLWFQAAHLLASSKKGISAHQLHHTLKVTYKTARFMAHRLHEAMCDGYFSPLGGEGQVAEIDETFVGCKETNKHASRRQRLGTGGVVKEAVLSLVERGGKVRSHHIPAVTAANLWPIVEAQNHGTTFVTDEGGAAKKVGGEFVERYFVNHGAGEYVRGDAYISTTSWNVEELKDVSTAPSQKKVDDPYQSKAFLQKAREIGADEDKSAADEMVRRLAKKPHEVRMKAPMSLLQNLRARRVGDIV